MHVSSKHFWQGKKARQTILQRKEQKMKVTAFENTAMLVVKEARTSLITDSVKKGSVPHRKATEDSKYHNLL